MPLHRLGGEQTAVAKGNRILLEPKLYRLAAACRLMAPKEWERVEQLSAKSLLEECDMLGLPGSECLECYGDFLAWRLKQVGSSDLVAWVVI